MADDRLDVVHQLVVRAVLETTIDQLAIVGGTLPSPKVKIQQQETAMEHPNLTDKSLEEILPVEKKVLQKSGGFQHMALKRLSLETSYIQGVLEDILDEVTESGGTYDALRESVQKSRQRKREREMISETEKEMRQEIHDLKGSIEVAKKRAESDVHAENLLIARLKDTLLEARRSTRGEEDFVRKLEEVRETERVKYLEEEEQRMVAKRDNLRRDLEHEQRVTLELESWLNDRKIHLRELHRFWTEKLKTDVAQKEQELQELIAARDADLKRREDAEERFVSATEFVRVEMEKREKLRLEKERVDLERRMAVRIQAWWRMTMVRKGLGPFKKLIKKQAEQQKAKNHMEERSRRKMQTKN